MAKLTLSELRLRSRQRADMESSEFVGDSEFNYYINSALRELHDILVQSYGENYYVKSATITTTPQQEEYAISSIVTDDDFYKLKGLDAQLNGDDFFTLQRFNFNERNRFQNFGTWDYLGLTNVRYQLLGSNLRLSPAPDAEVLLRMWYIPSAQELTADTDIYDDINGYSDYIVASAARRALMKEESDVGELDGELQFLKRRIEEASQNRDAGKPESIEDIYVENDDYFYTRTRS